MRSIRNVSVAWRLGVLAGVGILVALTMGIVSFSQARTVSRTRDTAAALDALNLAVTKADVAHSNSQLASREAILATTDTARSAAIDAQREAAADAATEASQSQHLALGLSSQVSTSVAGLNAAVAEYMAASTGEMDTLVKLDPSGGAGQRQLAVDKQRVQVVDDQTTATQALLARQAAVATGELSNALSNLRRAVIATLIIGLALMTAISLAVSRSITTPVSQMVTALQLLARKDLTVSVDETARDEIGQMGAALNQALGGIRAAMGSLGDTAGTLNTASGRLSQVSDSLEGTAQATASQAGRVCESAADVSTGVGAMSAATEQMSASIQEIASNASNAAGVAQSAVRTAAGAADAVLRLSEASTEIGEILRTITGIAEQTNLLALNATIEAARAGDAGKGFAVVATEVKELAHATARATDDIAHKIEAIQGTTRDATQAIAEIGEVISDINDLQTTIAAAVEQQSATTVEISRSVSDVAENSNAIASTIGTVSQAASSTSEGAAATQSSALELGVIAKRVDQLVNEFTY